jgi:hypothetical protein
VCKVIVHQIPMRICICAMVNEPHVLLVISILETSTSSFPKYHSYRASNRDLYSTGLCTLPGQSDIIARYLVVGTYALASPIGVMGLIHKLAALPDAMAKQTPIPSFRAQILMEPPAGT